MGATRDRQVLQNSIYDTARGSRRGVVFLNNRYHDPTLGSFVSVDPLVTQTSEPYIYGSANPITNSDPSGLCPYEGCWEAFDAYLRGLREASDYRQGPEELEPGAPLPLYRVIGHAEASAAASLAFNNPIGISGVEVDSRVEPRPEINPHYEDSGRAEFTLGINTGLCIFLVPCLEVGTSRDGPYIKWGVGVAIDGPGLVIEDENPRCGDSETTAYAALSAGPVSFGGEATRPSGSTMWDAGPGIGIELPDGGALADYKGVGPEAGVVYRWAAC